MRRLIARLRGHRPPPGGLTCRELVELVTDYLEDALGEHDGARFEAHIALCEGCAAYVAQVRATLVVVDSIAPEHLSLEAEQELLQRCCAPVRQHHGGRAPGAGDHQHLEQQP